MLHYVNKYIGMYTYFPLHVFPSMREVRPFFLLRKFPTIKSEAWHARLHPPPELYLLCHIRHIHNTYRFYNIIAIMIIIFIHAYIILHIHMWTYHGAFSGEFIRVYVYRDICIQASILLHEIFIAY